MKVKLPWLYRRRVEAEVRRVCRANDEAIGLSALERLPPLRGQLPRTSPDGIVFAACDDVYFYKYGQSFVRSARDQSADQSAHLHVYNPSEATLHTLAAGVKSCPEKVSFSWERTDPRLGWNEARPHCYFTAVRFVRLWQILTASRSPVLALDVDCEIRRSLSDAFARFQDTAEDVALFLRPRASKEWRRVLAAAVMVAPTELGHRFLRDLAAALVHQFRQDPEYHVDQLIVYFVWKWYSRKEPRFRAGRLAPTFSDWEYGDQSLVWHAKGDRKHALGEVEAAERSTFADVRRRTGT